ncbi:MAG TPA: carboxypeptidase-like regulatory domain-containing protein [Bryobacteraceae bacterium]|nr:carboxypeptidase-like regulatory domain-containing protein [Bryobacteraceae bacterium]
MLVLLAPAIAPGQTFQASVSGIVSDPTGAVVPKVKVTVTDTQRGVAFTALTNQDGVYLINNLIPSTYKVTAEAAGFQIYQLNSFPLTAKQEAVLNIVLQLGATNQTVEVSSQVQMVDPSNATLGGVVNNKSIVDLPLVNRNILTLMAIEPGVAPSTPNNYQSNFFTSAIRYSFNGGLESTSDFQLDGVSILNQSDIPGIMGLTMLPSVDAVDEMRVQTNSYSAVYGRSGGGITTMVTKSGTNSLHGNVFEFLRNNALNANNFFSNRSGAKIAPLHMDQYGGSVGGPIIKNKTFFFGLFERDVNNAGAFSLFSVPTAAMRAGDFSQDLNQAGQLRTIYNPFSTTPDPSHAGQFLRTPFPGNIIPKSLMDPAGAASASYWPAPNLPGQAVPGGGYTALNNLAATAVSANPLEQITGKVDHNFSPNKRGFIRFAYLYNVAGSPNYYNNLADTGYGPMTVHSYNAALGFTQTVGTATVVDLRFGVNRFSAFRPSNGLGFLLTKLGLPASLQTYMEQGDVDEFPGLTAQGYSNLGNNNGPYYSSNQLNYNASGSVLRVIGKHTLSIGAEHRDYFLNFFQTNPLVMNFANDMTQGPNPLAVSATAGDGVASMLLGTGTSGSAGYYARPANANHYFGEFVQDDIKWTRKLTMNVGFRLEEETAAKERYNRMAAIDPSVLNPISNQVTNPFTGQTPWNLYGGYVFAGSGPDSLGRNTIRGVEWKPSPRIGIAYSLDDKTVIRTGYGIFFGVPYDAATREFTSTAFQTATPWVNSLDRIHPNTLFSNPFPSGYVYPPGSSQGLLSAIGLNLQSALPSTLRTEYNQQWNFSIQRSIATNTLLQVAYVGNKGTHLAWVGGGGATSMNQLPPSLMSMGNQLLTLVNNPFFGVIPSGPLAQPQVQQGQLLRPFPAWQTVAADGTAIGNSEYDALQVSFTKRYTNGVSLIAGYTWSKLMSDVADGLWNDSAHNGSGAYRSWYCVRCEHSPSSYDVPHRFTLSAVGELPFGKGKPIGSNWNPVINGFLGGWQANGLLTLASGQPLFFYTAANNSYTFGGGQHPDVVGNPVLSSGKSIYQWFNTAAFAQPANFSSGNLARSYTGVRQDLTRNLDFSLFKNLAFKERYQFQFRAEAFNITNTPVFAAPGTTINGANFGIITGQSNVPRSLQLALKFLF